MLRKTGKIELEYGTDEEMRELAQHIIDTQQIEIELMQNWIAALEVTNTAESDDTDADVIASDDTTENKKTASDDLDTKTKEE